MLDTEKMNRLIARLEASDDRDFDMHGWSHCIAGHAYREFAPDNFEKFRRIARMSCIPHGIHPETVVRRELGLGRFQAKRLFYPSSKLWRNARYDRFYGLSEREIAIELLKEVRDRSFTSKIDRVKAWFKRLLDNNGENTSCVGTVGAYVVVRR